MPTLAEFRARLRAAVGHATDTTLLSDTTVDQCLTEALREVNRHFPSIGVASFNTAVGTQVYSPMVGVEGARSLVDVYYDPESHAIDLGPEVTRDEAGNLTVQRPFFELAAARLREFHSRFFAGRADIKGSLVYLDPIPQSVTAVYFTYYGSRFPTVADVDDEREASLQHYAEFRCHSLLAVGRGAISNVSGASGVSTTTRAPEHHKAAAGDAYQRFIDSLGPLAPIRGES